MLRKKMLAVINEVNSEVVEREELIECIALALLTRKNLFNLGETGQAKSYTINKFREHITGAQQFERLLTKMTDEESLFGRIDLNSYIAGNPRMITTGKIPDCHICFLDEIFKCNDGTLNSLLTALNEHRYTNEGETVDIWVISFFSASNEIPDFNDPFEKILRPLYDRFELKVVTQYIQNRDNRLRMLAHKQRQAGSQITATITLEELYAAQHEVASVIVPEAINELMDDILCELRRLGIHVSDRKFLNYYPIAQAKAWLSGRDIVEPSDLTVLKCYFWTKVEEITIIQQVLERFCVNPLEDRLKEIALLASESYDEFTSNVDAKSTKALIKLRGEFIRLYNILEQLRTDGFDNNGKIAVDSAIENLEKMSKTAHEKCNFTYAPLSELAKLQ